MGWARKLDAWQKARLALNNLLLPRQRRRSNNFGRLRLDGPPSLFMITVWGMRLRP